MGAKISKKNYFSHSGFGPISAELYYKQTVKGEYRLYLFWLPAESLKYVSLTFLVTQEHMGLEISKRYSYNFHPIPAKFYEDIGYHGGTQVITFLGISRIFEHFVAL